MRNAEIAVVTAQYAGVPAVLRGQRGMHQVPRLLAQRLQLAHQATALRLALQDEPAVSGPPAVVGESEKGEGFWTPLAAFSSSQSREATELDEARLLLMEQQAELGQSPLEVHQHLPRVRLFLESHDEVIGIPHDGHSTSCPPPPPLMDPEVEDIVEKDVGQERTDARTLRRSRTRLIFYTALENAYLQPHPNKPENSRISNSVRQHPQ